MRLKSVELFGFKSFPERTIITFGEGITAILGPNGCGKSNVVDAVKWALGEKSAKSLRGEEMQDVIFSGCASRSASGLAEVTLNFDNADHRLNIAYGEVAIRRRLTRARENCYFINNTPCRLRDVKALFMDTGIGNSSYWVIEQGRVEALLSARPLERRAIFEEAAGISRFKAQRKEILARLDRTGQALLRFADRLEEKERLIRKVSAQAASARRHRRLSEERDGLRTGLYRRQRAVQIALLEDIRRQREKLKSDLDGVEAALAAMNSRFAALTGEEGELAASHEATARAAAENQEARAGNQLDQAAARSRIEALENEIARGNERRVECAARLDRLAARRSGAEASLLAAREKAEDLERRFAERDGLGQRVNRRAAEAESRVTILRNRIIGLNARRQDLSGSVARCEAAEQSGIARLAGIAERLAGLGRERDDAAKAAEAAEAEYRLATEGFGAAADRLEGLKRENRDLAAALERLRDGELADEAEKAGLASRRAALEEMERNLDGAFEGPRNVILASRRGDRDCPGVVGMAGDLFRVPEDLALAFETILGASAQDILVETARDAQSAIEWLKRGRLGRATFLPLDRIQPRRRLERDFRHIPGVRGDAADLAAYDRRHAAALEHLLAGVLVVDHLDLARELAGREARGIKIVTLDGEVITPSGAMSGGRGKLDNRVGLVRRKAELETLAGKLAECRERLAEKGRRRGEIDLAMRGILAGIAATEKEMAEAGRSEAGLKQTLAARRDERDRLIRECSRFEAEAAALTAGSDGRREELERAKRDLEAVQAEIAGLEEAVQAGVEEQRRSREEAETLGREFAALAGERSEANAAVRELESRGRELEAEMAAAREELARPGLSVEQAGNEMATLRERLIGLEEREAELLRARDDLAGAASETAERMGRIRSAAEEVRREERDGQEQAKRLREGLAVLDTGEAQCALRIETILGKAKEELGLAPEALEASGGTEAEPAAGEERGEGGDAASPPPDAAPERETLSETAIQAKIDDLTQKIRNIGTVNPEAIDELAELEAGTEFLRARKEEMEEAAASIRTAVERLNADSATRFQATFEKARDNFRQIFSTLFDGGRAELLLEAPADPAADPLEVGVEIQAQPPGKEPKSISLLSGGEKALCAVALLFALFRSKPSPFCILDEVDGPLDEANIGRFMRQIRAFASDTQFIVITHSQLTMGLTDAIWGVTQKIAGISNIHSLDYEAMEKLVRKPSAGKEKDRKDGNAGKREIGRDAPETAGTDAAPRLALASL
ncbi:MAG: chromosome segregation protein SMC [Planctomycetota bacterium]|jgi:chromosome segregation protein|nr:chromosome segregation protein SMC [Planctomycetota bacterium]